MDAKWLMRVISGCGSDKCKKQQQNQHQCKKQQKNQHQGQSTSMAERVEDKLPQPVSDCSSNLQSADTCRAHLHDIRYEEERCICTGIEDQDVDMAAGIFIDKVHRDLELQRTLSDARYYEYLERAT